MKTDRYILVILAIIVAICTLANMLRKRNMVSKKSEMVYGMKSIYLAGGCFWGVEKYFDQFDGVVFTEVGYANGPASIILMKTSLMRSWKYITEKKKV